MTTTIPGACRHQSETPLETVPEARAAEKNHNTEADSIPYPFCRLADKLEIIHWSNERADGSEYMGDAVRCNRCDAIAPVAAWLSLSFPEHQTGNDG